jgi:hypothetical protein
MSLLLIGYACLTFQGCTYRAWYEGFQEKQRQECYESSSESEVRKCLDRVNRTTYDQYKKDRDRSAQSK